MDISKLARKTLVLITLASAFLLICIGVVIGVLVWKLAPHSQKPHQIANGTILRIMPLGDSITWGWESSDGNGYRLGLQELLSENTVQYIGSQRSGNMADNYNEGHPGALIDEIAAYANLSLWEMPNIVLVMAGTNDMDTNLNVSTAPERLGSLIDEIVDACPDAAVLVAQLIPSMTSSTDARIKTFNAALPGIVALRTNAGKKVMEVNMDDYFGEKDLQDDLHPSDEGYLRMAVAWYDGIQEADEKGLISPLTNSTDPVR